MNTAKSLGKRCERMSWVNPHFASLKKIERFYATNNIFLNFIVITVTLSQIRIVFLKTILICDKVTVRRIKILTVFNTVSTVGVWAGAAGGTGAQAAY